MGKRNNHSSAASAPIGVLLSKRSEDSIKKGLGRRAPLAIRYTKDDLKLLLEILNGVSGEEILKNDRTFMTILINLHKAIENNSPHEAFEFMHSKKWGKASKLAYYIMYETTLEQVPLHLNEEYTNRIARWRLLINK